MRAQAQPSRDKRSRWQNCPSFGTISLVAQDEGLCRGRPAAGATAAWGELPKGGDPLHITVWVLILPLGAMLARLLKRKK
jgi:hypothetical protein